MVLKCPHAPHCLFSCLFLLIERSVLGQDDCRERIVVNRTPEANEIKHHLSFSPSPFALGWVPCSAIMVTLQIQNLKEKSKS